MPLYEHKCTSCSLAVDIAASIADRDAPQWCPTCKQQMRRIISAPMLGSMDSSRVGDAYSAGGLHGQMTDSDCPPAVRELRQQINAGTIPRGKLRTSALCLARTYETARKGGMAADGIVDNCRRQLAEIARDPNAPVDIGHGLKKTVSRPTPIKTRRGRTVMAQTVRVE